ncbi:MAG: class I tRNA ligase family protein [Minisyncoccia bacterium]
MAENQGKSETAKREEEILAFWRENKTFERSLEKDSPKGEFVFYDGPPFATGLPHHGSLLSSIIKDVVPRYKTMRGYRVRRRWGWDTHGLPIESLVEKELGLKTKKDILEIGIAKFNEAARSMVLKYVADWKVYVERVGRWVDYENSYKTMDNTFIESVWWALKQLWDKDLLYEGRKVLMYCPHCETPLAKAEIAMDNTYKDITEEAVTVKFKVKNPEQHGLPENTFILAWTTTPWTLPGNVALAVGPEVTYALSKQGDEHFVTSENLVPKDAGVVKKVLANDLVGISYEPLFDIPQMRTETSHEVYAADFVTTGEGTGIVHTAVMYGEDDYVLGQKEKLPMVQMLNPNGTYLDTMPELLRGKYIKDAERDIKKDLETRGLMFKRENHTHSYPHCWRCGTPLIYNAVPSWFINIQKIKAKMLSENEKVNWVPEHLKHGRFYNIVDNAPDWTISRNRFWASPLPIWKNKDGKVMVIGSLDEIKQRAKKSGNTYFLMRHGETTANVENIISSDINADIHLTEKGEEQVRKAAQGFSKGSFDYILTSPFKRTRQTAEILAKELSIPSEKILIEQQLHEIEMGDLSGIKHAEWHKLYPENVERFSRAPKGGETHTEVRQRMGKFLLDLETKYAEKRILIVSHGTPLLLLIGVVNGFSKEKIVAVHDEMYPETGSITELPVAPLPWNADFELDLHRPYTDSLVLIGDDGEEYTRIPEVVDCWVESGSMPFAEHHYPFANKAEFEKSAPGDFIAEYIAQTRTWFYYLHAMGVALFDRLAFKNVVSTGNLLAADGQKISKSKGNYTDPLELIDVYGSDAYRMYLMNSPVMQAEDVRFRDEDVRDTHNRIIGILWNTFKFFDLYQKEYDGTTKPRTSEHVLDRWILARLDETTAEATAALDAYDTPRTCRAIKSFVDDYSTWYVRRSRERVKSEWHDKHHSLATQKEVLLTLAKVIAPIMPFIADSIYRGIEGGGSVHLEAWPEVPADGFLARILGGTKQDSILEDMAKVRAAVSRALEARDKAGIKVRQPLAKLTIKRAGLSDELLDVIREEVNVKGVEQADIETDVELDTNLTAELKEEGIVRETIRAVQDARKKAGLKPGERGKVTISVSSDDRDIVERNLAAIQEQTKAEVSIS